MWVCTKATRSAKGSSPEPSAERNSSPVPPSVPEWPAPKGKPPPAARSASGSHLWPAGIAEVRPGRRLPRGGGRTSGASAQREMARLPRGVERSSAEGGAAIEQGAAAKLSAAWSAPVQPPSGHAMKSSCHASSGPAGGADCPAVASHPASSGSSAGAAVTETASAAKAEGAHAATVANRGQDESSAAAVNAVVE